jgi:hypothetical protein
MAIRTLVSLDLQPLMSVIGVQSILFAIEANGALESREKPCQTWTMLYQGMPCCNESRTTPRSLLKYIRRRNFKYWSSLSLMKCSMHLMCFMTTASTHSRRKFRMRIGTNIQDSTWQQNGSCLVENSVCVRHISRYLCTRFSLFDYRNAQERSAAILISS